MSPSTSQRGALIFECFSILSNATKHKIKWKSQERIYVLRWRKQASWMSGSLVPLRCNLLSNSFRIPQILFVQGVTLWSKSRSWKLELPSGQVNFLFNCNSEFIILSQKGQLQMTPRLSPTKEDTLKILQWVKSQKLNKVVLIKTYCQQKDVSIKQQINFPGKEEPHDRGEHK